MDKSIFIQYLVNLLNVELYGIIRGKLEMAPLQ